MAGPPTSGNSIPQSTGAQRRGSGQHHRVNSMVGSLGRQSFFVPLSKREREQARTLVFSDRLDGEHSGALTDGGTLDAPLNDSDSDDDGRMLEEGFMAPSEQRRAYNEERELLRESERHYGSTRSVEPPVPDLEAGPSTGSSTGAVTAGAATTTAVRGAHLAGAESDPPGWEEALNAGKIETTVRLELRTLFMNSIPLAITFMLQYSLIMASLFSVGHLGKVELGAVSLGGMTASITGIAFIQGMSTCLDTLCSQAYGAGRPDLVGLYFQKGVIVVMLGLLPVLALWYRADIFLPLIVADEDADSDRLIDLATQYLRIMIFAMPGYCLFECGKRFMQAQGIFHASTLVLFVCAPLNIFLTYTLVWNERIGMGFIGAPISVAITNTMLALLLLLYVLFIDGRKCWNGFTWKVFHNWGPLVQLAVPGLVMVESEFLAYEIMTLASSYLGTNELATQTILSSITSLAYEVPFAVGCAASTRVAGFIGAGLPKAAALSAKVAVGVSLCLGLSDITLIMVFRHTFSGLFSSDPNVVQRAAHYIPLCAAMHLLDALGAVLAGVLRGQGRQSIGGYVNLAGYYLVGVPLGLFLCFGPWKLGLVGIWLGFISALLTVVLSSLVALRMSDWNKYVYKARSRN